MFHLPVTIFMANMISSNIKLEINFKLRRIIWKLTPHSYKKQNILWRANEQKNHNSFITIIYFVFVVYRCNQCEHQGPRVFIWVQVRSFKRCYLHSKFWFLVSLYQCWKHYLCQCWVRHETALPFWDRGLPVSGCRIGNKVCWWFCSSASNDSDLKVAFPQSESWEWDCGSKTEHQQDQDYDS